MCQLLALALIATIYSLKKSYKMKKVTLLLAAFSTLLASCGGAATDSTGTDSTGNKSTDAPAQETVAKPKAPAAEGPIRILFVGNSHTEFYVSLPDLMTAICKENGKEVVVEELVEMGVAIDEILAANKAKADKSFAATDKDGNYYDYILLQEKTPVAVQELDKYKANCKTLVDMAGKNSPGAAVYVYQLMSPVAYKDNVEEFKEYQNEINKNAIAVAKSLPNAGVYRLGEAVADAYAGKNGYTFEEDGNELLRHGQNSLHMLNDAGYMASVLLYETIFGAVPKMPAQLPLSTGTGDSDQAKLQDVATTISNAEALNKIADSYK